MINLPPEACHPKEWHYNGHFMLVAATDYWQTGCIKVAVPRSSLVNEFHNAELMCNLHHSSIFALVVKPLRNARSSGKVATWPPQTGHLCHLFIKVLLCWGHPFVSLHLGDKYPHIFAFRCIYIHIPHFQTCCLQISNHFFPFPWTICPNNLVQTIHLNKFVLWSISPSRHYGQLGVLLKVLPSLSQQSLKFKTKFKYRAMECSVFKDKIFLNLLGLSTNF